MFSDWALRTLFYVFRLSSELVSKFKNSVLVQKSIKSAIQRHLFFFSSEIDQERDPKTFKFFQIEVWVDIHFFLKSSSALVSKFKNSIRLWKPIQSTIYRLLIFFRSSSGLVFKFKNSILVQKSIKSAIQRLLIFFRLGLWVDIRFFQIELWVGS